MALLQRLPVILAATALLLGASVLGSDVSVLCFGVGDGHMAVESAGPEHCGGEAEHADACGVAGTGGCVDLTLQSVDLDRPTEAGPTVLPKPLVALLPPVAPVLQARSMALGASPARPPPPHLVVLPTFILRI